MMHRVSDFAIHGVFNGEMIYWPHGSIRESSSHHILLFVTRPWNAFPDFCCIQVVHFLLITVICQIASPGSRNSIWPTLLEESAHFGVVSFKLTSLHAQLRDHDKRRSEVVRPTQNRATFCLSMSHEYALSDDLTPSSIHGYMFPPPGLAH